MQQVLDEDFSWGEREAGALAVAIPEALAGLPVAAQIGSIDFDRQNIVMVSQTGSGKTVLMASYECLLRKQRGEAVQVWVRQPTRVSCFSIHKALKHFWGDRLTIGICTADDKRDLDADIVLYSDGSLRQGLAKGPIVYFDEAHSLNVPQAEIELAVAKMRGLRVRALSATIDPKTIIDYLPGAAFHELSGRTFPIEKDVQWIPEEGFDRGASLDALDDAMGAIVLQAFQEKCRTLVFLPTKDLVERMARMLDGAEVPCRFAHGDVYPQDLLEWVEARRDGPFVVFCTIALATGVTLPLDRVAVFDERMGSHMQNGILRSFPQKFDSNTLIQCAGRVGRTHPGKATIITSRARRPRGWDGIVPGPIETPCSKTTPYGVILALAQEGVKEVSRIDLLSRLDPSELAHAQKWLLRHGCVRDDGGLTQLGRRVQSLPLEVPYAHLVLTAPTAETRLMAYAAVTLGLEGSFGLLSVKAGKESAARLEADPSFEVLPAECVVLDSMPATMAAILQRAFRARSEDNASETLRGWCEGTNLRQKALEFAMRDFEKGAAFLTQSPRLDLLALDVRAHAAALDAHMMRHPTLVEASFPDGEWGKAGRMGTVLDSAATDAFRPAYPMQAWGVPKEIVGRRGSRFWSLALPIVRCERPSIFDEESWGAEA